MENFQFLFKPVAKTQQQLIHEWIAQPHINQWLHGEGLKNTIKDLEQFVHAKNPWAMHWIAYDNDVPFAYLLTSELEKTLEQPKSAITLDLFIGRLDYIGKGIAVQMIHELLMQHFLHVEEVHIDPEIRNERAVHVYKKAGFKITGEFIAPWHPVPHYKMRLIMADIIQP
ncbi:GNAT family N-acetyltransferase [Legionella oakridgensis]|uniref:Acetyltransferase, including N-acetylases of ribosomal protein n=2 Tax=Legionella oakridgensis TaxID=29423 RepID=W0BDY6_9GAMM|nr:GNAT family N-acetyltransferase [Legionella oakridgensis]AHE66906.1 acetyltransferase, including N-acetylases of ribosomal protein [Legionella oakridgensis ATCC 33761 = DSM 21215]ETO93431.1 acetyltransferase, including N-acetylase of ribosomal protein [Legionella oakridgensis RV-2-2007]KTD37155.1 aminoglycoside N(6')acetyltransferase [Legionella oakridgensis]STY20012.1 aminoglycoside N(6')acetyltransferase [Legionella longbeachae]